MSAVDRARPFIRTSWVGAFSRINTPRRLRMAGMDGFTLLDRVRSQASLRELKVLVLSAMELSTSEEAFLLTRGCTIIPKGPNARAALLSALKGLRP